ncbi:UDP-2,4-diacetamido-2,4,6-trideoxy-beta-L-altropyranose hydrolase [Paenibacillus campi]|uniref:UDP-2,4-diacetamido-2,4, 6-trideoxy-beta-L-altropyranose hydrolase n=1 Tax=Paenibacillus campi TaxID=3106031 RepID=UPI002AFE56F0|nr:UDP-2,4-diacetamido-2,4,6-trideoxy-beta-L-altropyranose hydrolase [Paenibacillus sp. SGZ-1014]
MSTIVIRVDASAQIGIGHVMRCLTLADMLTQSLSCHIIFICADHIPHELAAMIHARTYTLHLISKSTAQNRAWEDDADQTLQYISQYAVDWLIVDHYNLDEHWEKKMRNNVNHILVIDDLANRPHDCQALLDQNLHPEMNTRYMNKIPPDCRAFLGPTYILLRPEFQTYRKQRKKIEHCHTILINFGGSDPTHETEKLLHLLIKLPNLTQQLYFHIVAGPANTRREQIRQLCSKLPSAVYYEQADMANLLLHTDLAIGAGGITMWERCFMGVPSGVIIVADNQLESVHEAERLQFIWNLGKSDTLNEQYLMNWLEHIVQNIEELRKKQQQCIEYFSYYSGYIHPVVEYIKGEL